jgi:hypothetical protein
MQVDGYGAYKALTRRTEPGRIRAGVLSRACTP